MFKKIIILTTIILFLAPTIANAVGVSVTPSKLLVETQVNKLSKISILIKNPSTNVSIYDIYPDDYSNWLKISPSSFTLEAGEIREVGLQIKIPEPGAFATQISIVAKPLSSRKFQANSGLKIPFELKAVQSKLDYRSFIWRKIFSLTNIILAIYAVISLMFINFVIKRVKQTL